MKKITFLLTLLLPFGVSAQSLQDQGKNVESIVPEGWGKTHVVGDLNKDGVDDLALVAIPDFKEKQKVRDDGYVYDFNQPILAIYFGTADGTFKLWKQYPEVMPVNEDEFGSVTFALKINKKGALLIDIDWFLSVGSNNTPKHTYVFRYQDNDFFLIGQESHLFSRTSGEAIDESYNYLIHKCCKTLGNGFDDTIKPRTTWSKLPKEPLKRLGSEELF